jgi:hypothetical protein
MVKPLPIIMLIRHQAIPLGQQNSHKITKDLNTVVVSKYVRKIMEMNHFGLTSFSDAKKREPM